MKAERHEMRQPADARAQAPDPATRLDVRQSDVDALILDRYLDVLLAGSEPATSPVGDGGVPQAELREIADLVRRSFVRVHPSFRFEEQLSARLATLAAGRSGGSGLGAVIPWRAARAARDARMNARFADARHAAAGHDQVANVDLASIEIDRPADLPGSPGARRSSAVRPLLIGGAITSAAVSLAGVAWVARRVVRAPALTELEGLL
jgi:hypothetical protein